MASAIPNPENPLVALGSAVETVSALLNQLEAAIKVAPKTEQPLNDVNALFLAHDAAKLIRAHTTKLSLLIINAPFTPTAIVKVLRELSVGPLPSLTTAVELCDTHTYSESVRAELIWMVHKVFDGFGAFLKEIPLDGKVLSNDRKNGTGDTGGKGSLASTGVLWQACDDLMDLKNIGIAGIVVKKAEQYRDTLKDAIEELQEWGAEESDEESGDEDANADDGADDIIHNAAQDEIDNLFAPPSHIPNDDPDHIRPRLELSLRRLKLIALMFNALIKRRFRTLSSLSLLQLSTGRYPTNDSNPKMSKLGEYIAPPFRIDTSLKLLREITHLTDNLVNAFYELDTKEVDHGMDECFFASVGVTELLSQNWGGKDDEFTAWVSTKVTSSAVTETNFHFRLERLR